MVWLSGGDNVAPTVVTLIEPGTGKLYLGKAEDEAHESGSVGVMLLGVRKDTAGSLADADGDYVPLIVDGSGRLHIAPLPDGTATIGKLGANSGVDIGDVDVKSLPVGNTTMAGSTPVTLASDDGIGTVVAGHLEDLAGAVTSGGDEIYIAGGATQANDVKVTLDSEPVVLGDGTATIGKLGANSGVDIGDVDVTSVPGALQGPGNPVVDSFANASVSLSAGTANQVLVAAPGVGKQIWVYGLHISADTGSGTVALQDEDDTALTGAMAMGDEGMITWPMSGNFAMPWLKVATNKALEADTTGVGTYEGVITYAVVSV